MEVVNALGRRKAAVARVFVCEGSGVVTINKRELAVYFPSSILPYYLFKGVNIYCFRGLCSMWMLASSININVSQQLSAQFIFGEHTFQYTFE